MLTSVILIIIAAILAGVYVSWRAGRLDRLHARVEAARVVTNIVSFEVDPDWMDTAAFVRACADRGLRLSRYLGNSPRLRAVTHHGIERADIDEALAIVSEVLSGARAPLAVSR